MFAYDAATSAVTPGRALEETPDTKTRRTVTPKKFGRHLRELRKQRSLTQERLAESCDLSSDAIRRLEAGAFSPSLQTLTKLTDGLNVSLTTLFAGLERGRDIGQELADYLRTRTPKERELAWRVVRSLFDET